MHGAKGLQAVGGPGPNVTPPLTWPPQPSTLCHPRTIPCSHVAPKTATSVTTTTAVIHQHRSSRPLAFAFIILILHILPRPAPQVSIRHARQKAIDVAKKAFSSTDERKAAEKRVQALTDSFISEVDRLKAIKDKELREHES